MENQYRVIVHCYVTPKSDIFGQFIYFFVPLHIDTPWHRCFCFSLWHRASPLIRWYKKKKKDSRGASFTFEAATAISTIRSRLFFPPIVLARGSVHIEKQFCQLQGHIHRQVRDILVKSSRRNVEGKVISPKRRTCSFERNGGWCGPTHVKSPCSVIPWPQGCATPHACSLNTRVVADHVKTGSTVARYFCRFVKPAR